MILGSEDTVLLFGLYPWFLELNNDPWFGGYFFIVWPLSLVLRTEQ
jgi:hypothetical protein